MASPAGARRAVASLPRRPPRVRALVFIGGLLGGKHIIVCPHKNNDTVSPQKIMPKEFVSRARVGPRRQIPSALLVLGGSNCVIMFYGGHTIICSQENGTAPLGPKPGQVTREACSGAPSCCGARHGKNTSSSPSSSPSSHHHHHCNFGSSHFGSSKFAVSKLALARPSWYGNPWLGHFGMAAHGIRI